MDTSNLFFIQITSLQESQGFTDWMRKKKRAVTCMDTIEFSEWLKQQNMYPFSIYLDGATYEFKDERQMLLFLVGFEAAMNLRFPSD